MKIYETDQWSACQVAKQNLTITELAKADNEVYGGDADSVRVIFGGGHVYPIEVKETDTPRIGHVWFKADENGVLKVYKTNYDSSD